MAIAGLKKKASEARAIVRDLAKRRDVVENPEGAAVRADDDIVAVDYEIAHGSGGQVELQRLPGVAIVERDIDGAFGAGEEQAGARGLRARR